MKCRNTIQPWVKAEDALSSLRWNGQQALAKREANRLLHRCLREPFSAYSVGTVALRLRLVEGGLFEIARRENPEPPQMQFCITVVGGIHVSVLCYVDGCGESRLVAGNLPRGTYRWLSYS